MMRYTSQELENIMSKCYEGMSGSNIFSSLMFYLRKNVPIEYNDSYPLSDIKKVVDKWEEMRKNELDGLNDNYQALESISVTAKTLLKSIENYKRTKSYTPHDVRCVVENASLDVPKGLKDYISLHFASAYRFERTYSLEAIVCHIKKWGELKKEEFAENNIAIFAKDVDDSMAFLESDFVTYEHDEEEDKEAFDTEVEYIVFLHTALRDKLADDSIDDTFKDKFFFFHYSPMVCEKMRILDKYAHKKGWRTRPEALLYVDDKPVYFQCWVDPIWEGFNGKFDEKSMYIAYKRYEEFSLNYKSNEYILKDMPDNVKVVKSKDAEFNKEDRNNYDKSDSRLFYYIKNYRKLEPQYEQERGSGYILDGGIYYTEKWG